MHIHGMDRISQTAKETAQRCAAVSVLRAGRSVTRLFDDALRPVGLTIAQFGLLNAIASYRPDSISAIGEMLNIDRTTLSRNLALLQREGLVMLGTPGPDRKREVLLTVKGAEKIEEALPLWEAAQRRIEALFEPGEYDMLKKALSRIRHV